LVETVTGPKELLLNSGILLGGYENFVEPPAAGTEIGRPDRTRIMDDFVHQWLPNPTQSHSLSNINILGLLSSFALKVVAGEWVNYITVMDQSMKNY